MRDPRPLLPPPPGRLLPAALLLLFACAHEAPRGFGRQSTLALAPSHRCEGGACTCRDPESSEDQEERAPIADGQKRFEFRLGPTVDALWLEIDGRGQLYKGSESAGGVCVYVDLPAGQKTRIRYHVEAQEPTRGTELDARVAEYGPRVGAWYDTFRFRCGGGGVPCDTQLLDEWLKAMHGLVRGIRDPCGSTKLEEPRWAAPPTDMPHPAQVTVELLLGVHRFPTHEPPGSTECGKRHKDNVEFSP